MDEKDKEFELTETEAATIVEEYMTKHKKGTTGTPPSQAGQNHFNYGDNKGYNYTNWQGNTYKACKHPAIEVFTFEGVTYCGGSAIYVEDVLYSPHTLIVSLTGERRGGIMHGSEGWQNLINTFNSQPEEWMAIKWPDMSSPNINLVGFWNGLHENAKARGITKVIFYCFGGHGRTGSALASILVECVDYTPEEAIAIIRKVYCEEAVETKSQEAYLANLYKANHKELVEVVEVVSDEPKKKGKGK